MSSTSEDWVMVDDDAYFYEEECPSTTDEDATEDHVERENSPGIDAVGLGTALVLGATVGLGVGVSVAAVATIASRHIQQHGPSMMEKLGIKAFWKRKPLTSERWCEEVDGEGHVRNFRSLLEEVSKGGVSSDIRVTVWPFLVGLMDPNSSADERFERLEALRRKYDSLVGRCRTLHTELEDDEREASSEAADPTRDQAEEYKENRRILALDLVRTDFSSMALEEEDGGEVPAEPAEEDDARALGLHDPIESAEYLSPQKRRCAKVMGKLLLCYSVHDPQTGYCQGMTDLIQPFVQTFRDESACFWAFATFMESARENFMSDESGIMTRLSLVKMVMADISPEVFSYLNEIGAESFFFSYRMILVLLRRELSVENTMLFWEVMWAEDLLADREPGVPDFLVFSIVALIMGKSHEITTSCKAESDVVYMFCNLKVNVWHMIEAARFCRKKWLAIGAPEAVT